MSWAWGKVRESDKEMGEGCEFRAREGVLSKLLV